MLKACSNPIKGLELKMGQARGSAIVATMLLLYIMLPSCEISDATNYTVGDDDGWNFKVHDWPTGKKFHTHDTLGKS